MHATGWPNWLGAHINCLPNVKTKPTRSAKEKRLTGKSLRSDVKKGRGKIRID
jgi:ribosome-associated protein